jgi:uncharacterized protein YndB with AHSA1/START domain
MGSIRVETIYAAPIGAVWRALTDPEELASWLMPNDFQPVVGHQFTFRTHPAPGFDGIVHCEVLEVELERRLSYSWVGGGVKTQVSFTLEPHGAGTKLTLLHSGFAGARGVLVQKILSTGWRSMVLRRLGEHVEAMAAG